MKKLYTLLCGLVLMCGTAMANTIEIEFENVDWADVVAGQGWWQLWGYNADSTYYVNISPNYTDHLDGVYDNSEMYYSKMYDMTNMTQVNFVSGTHTMVTSDEKITLTCDLVGDDGNNYKLTVNHIIPEPEPVVIEMNIPEATLNDQTDAEGWWQLYGYDADSMYYATFSTLNDPRLVGTFSMSDMDTDYTYAIIMPGTMWAETVRFGEGTIEVADINGHIELNAELLGRDNGYTYKISMSTVGEDVPVSIQSMTVTNKDGQTVKIYENGQFIVRRGDMSWSIDGLRR